ncbi:MAG: hypothetical protein WB870_10815 [Gallionellaceae bacterium]
MSDAQKRLWQTLSLAEKEGAYLEDVAGRLFAVPEITAEWIERLIASPEGRDRLEAFVGKFSRMQDTLIDKLLPNFLAAAGERPGAVIDNLNRAERLGLLADTDRWLSMRRLRNRLVHEYVEDRAELAAALTLARAMTGELLNACRALRSSAEAKFVHTAAGNGDRLK